MIATAAAKEPTPKRTDCPYCGASFDACESKAWLAARPCRESCSHPVVAE